MLLCVTVCGLNGWIRSKVRHYSPDCPHSVGSSLSGHLAGINIKIVRSGSLSNIGRYREVDTNSDSFIFFNFVNKKIRKWPKSDRRSPIGNYDRRYRPTGASGQMMKQKEIVDLDQRYNFFFYMISSDEPFGC